jgi:hypothetical protein
MAVSTVLGSSGLASCTALAYGAPTSRAGGIAASWGSIAVMASGWRAGGSAAISSAYPGCSVGVVLVAMVSTVTGCA